MITGTTFDRFGSCGAIIRNFKTVFSATPSYTSLSHADPISVFKYRLNSLQSSIYNDINSESTLTSSPYSSCSTDPTLGVPCFSITITSSTFSYFSFQSRTISFPYYVNPQYGM